MFVIDNDNPLIDDEYDDRCNNDVQLFNNF